MRKIIKLKLENTNRIRTTEDTYCEIYSHDKNNGLFEFEIVNEYLTVENPKAVFKFVGSNKVWQTDGTVVDGRIKVKFDTTLITHDEIVVCWLYLDEEQRSSDAYRFKFKVKLSEIDKVDGYETKERFIKDTVIVDRLDVVTREDLDRAIKSIQTGTFSKEGLLTEAKAEETYAKKSEAVDNTNFELVKNRILALELKTDKDTVYDDSEIKGRISVLEAKHDNDTVYDDTNVRERLTALESKPNIDVNTLATKQELNEVRNSQPTVDTSTLVTKQELEEKHYLTAHQDLSEYALKSELYNDTPLKERVTALESKAIEGGAYNDKPIRDRLDVLEAKHDNDTIYDDTEVKRRLTELESRPTVDTSVFVTDEKLNGKGYLTQHQDLSSYALKSEIPQPYNDTEVKERLGVLETKTDKDTVYDDTAVKERLTALESKAIEGGAYDDSDLRNRVVALESKEDKDTKYDDTDLRNRVTTLENKPAIDTSEFVTNQALESKGYIKDVSNLVTKQELDNKHFLTEHQDLSSLVTKQELENKGYLTQHQPLDNLVTKEELNSKGYITNETLNSKGYLTQHQDLSGYVTSEQLEAKHFLTEHQPLTHLATNSDLEALRNVSVSKSELSKKLDTTEYNTFKDSVVTKTELAEKGYLTTHQDISNLATKQEVEDTYAKKSELPTPYNDSNMDRRISRLERGVTINAAEVNQKLTALESRPNVDTSNFVTNEVLNGKGYLTEHQNLDGYVKKSELGTLHPNQTLTLNNGTLSISGGNSVELPVNRFEIHGTGMPNGVVEAEIGTTYIDKNKTNGAFKWIKTTNGGNQGWEVLTGDTGWRTLSSVSKLGNSFVKIRRVNNEVTYQFGGLSWGWFGIVRRGGAGYVMQTTDTERNCFILGEHGIPAGFRTPSSLIGSIYNDRGTAYGTWYVGNGGDANHLRFQFLNPIPTDSDIGDIRVSQISYLTDEAWPQQLP